jgi:signal transduction histidine kinase/CheY-like chemotaxis protein/HPt (histidine-containing phosphotransfer) domain-containing protein
MRLPHFLRNGIPWLASLKARTWLACCSLAAICFIAVCVSALLDARADAERQAAETASNIASIVERDVISNVGQIDLALRTAVDGLQLPGIWELSPQIRNLVLFDRASEIPYLGFINVLNEAGDVIADPQPAQHVTNWASRDYFMMHRRDAAPGIYVGRPFPTTQEDRASITLSRRVSHADGTFAGVAVMGLRLGYFRDLFAHLAPGRHGTITLLRSDAVVLMRLPFDRNDIGRTLEGDTAFTGLMRTGPSGIAVADPVDHVRRQFAVQQIGSLPLIVRIGVASGDIGGSWQRWQMAMIAGAAVMLIVSVALISALQRESWRREAAEQSNRNKSQYLATISHELRTPLHSILGNADRLRASCHLDPDEARHVAAIAGAAGHLRGVVDRLMNNLQIEFRAPNPNMGRVDLHDLLDQCRAFVEPDATARGLAVRCVPKDVPRCFITDGVMLRLILLNLLGNAIKFTEQGEVVVEAGGTEERISIEIIDTGCGIPVEQRHKLFQDFERLGAEKTGIEGNGLGLAMSRRLLNAMGGEIGYRDNPGGGSVFWIALPSGTLPEVTARCPDVTPPDRRLRVLLVDNDAMNREIARDILRSKGHAVTQARDGHEAVRLAGVADYDIVLMDVRMTGIDGLESTRRIRSIRGQRGRVPIVAVTANALDAQVRECHLAGMVGHLAKPFAPDELLKTVARVAINYPRAQPADPAALDPEALVQLASFMDADAIEHQLLHLSRNIETLLEGLEQPDPTSTAEALAEVAHELAGSAGTFGFAALSAGARQFETAITVEPAKVEATARILLQAARAALVELRELTSPEAVAAA